MTAPAGSPAGRLLYRLYHAPRTALEAWRDARFAPYWDATMRRAAAAMSLPSLPAADPCQPPVRFLTGARFAHQTVFCARSFVLACGERPRMEFFDDGSLSSEQADRLLALFPNSHLYTATECLERIERLLPVATFPALRELREHSPLIRKLLDLRVGFDGPSLYLDSDMLFFDRPRLLIEWMRRPTGSYHMHETGGSGAYVDSREILSRQLGLELPLGVNTGIVAIDDSAIDWPALESIARLFMPKQRRHIWAEQTLMACHLSAHASRPLPADEYRVCTSRRDLKGALPILRHYVYKAKMPYIQSEWRTNLRQLFALPIA